MLRIPQRFPKAKAGVIGSLALIVGFFGSLSILNSFGVDVPGVQGQVLSSTAEDSTMTDADKQQNSAARATSEGEAWEPTPPPPQQMSSVSTTLPSTAGDGVEVNPGRGSGSTTPVITNPVAPKPIIPEPTPQPEPEPTVCIEPLVLKDGACVNLDVLP